MFIITRLFHFRLCNLEFNNRLKGLFDYFSSQTSAVEEKYSGFVQFLYRLLTLLYGYVTHAIQGQIMDHRADQKL